MYSTQHNSQHHFSLLASALVSGAILFTSIFYFNILEVAAFGQRTKTKDHFVRIAIYKSIKDITISALGKYHIEDVNSDEVFDNGRALRDYKVRFSQIGVMVGASIYETDHLRFASTRGIVLTVKNEQRIYRGYIDILRNPDQTLMVINYLPLERYVRGVLYHEITDEWPIQAMMAQAVATRTYALFRIQENEDLPYDMTNDIFSQVYGGKSSEKYRTTLAVKRTKGQVLMYQGQILPAYFHSNSGGHTEDVTELWKHEPIQALSGKPDPYSLNAPLSKWKKNMRSKDIQEILNQNDYAIDLIKDIRIKERTQSNRVKTLEIETRKGKIVTVSGKEFRHWIGPNILKSNLYEIEMKGYFFDVIGKGWGHGVGMSQWGAHEMSKQKKSYREILEFYYPGAELKKLK